MSLISSISHDMKSWSILNMIILAGKTKNKSKRKVGQVCEREIVGDMWCARYTSCED